MEQGHSDVYGGTNACLLSCKNQQQVENRHLASLTQPPLEALCSHVNQSGPDF